MLVSIVTPCFNPNLELIETIESVQKQTYSDYEHIIIDDCSTSKVPEELLRVVDADPKIKFVQRSWNAGPAVTRNRGIAEAKGNFIAFLDADDIWHARKLELQLQFMQDNDVSLSYTSYEVFDTKGKVIGLRTPPSSLTYTDILQSNQIGCLTAMYSVDALGKVYMPNISKRQDMGLWLKILKMGVIAKRCDDKPLARYRVGGKSVSSNKLGVLKYQWRIYREVERLSLRSSIKYFGHYAFKGMIRKV